MLLKKKLIALFSVFALAFTCVGITAFNVSTAKAANTPQTIEYVFEAGASVRLKTGSSGLRFTALMNPSDYTALKSNTAYESVSFGMIIVPKDYQDTHAVDKASVFGIGGTRYYTFEENENGYARVLNLTSDTLVDYTDKEMNVHKAFKGVITNILPANYAREFVATAYIKTVEAGTGTIDYEFTSASDNRSVVYVSQIALSKGETDVDGILSGFVTAVKEAGTTTDYTVEHYKANELGGYDIVSADTEVLSAVIGTKVTPTAKNYAGLVAQEIKETEVLANGKTVIKIYYDSAITNILVTEADLDAGNLQAHDTSYVTLTYMDRAVGGRSEGVFEWKGIKEGAKSSTSTLKPGTSMVSKFKAGSYVYLDVFFVEDVRFYMTYNLYAPLFYSLYNDATHAMAWQWYDEYGREITATGGFHGGDTYYGQWVTIEFYLPENLDGTSNWRGFMAYEDMNGKTLYLSNVRVSAVKLEIEEVEEPAVYTILNTKEDLQLNKLKPSDTNYATLTYMDTAVGGRDSGVFAWSGVKANAVTSSCNLQPNSNVASRLKAGRVLYMDVYFTDNTQLLVMFGGGNWYVYAKYANTATTLGKGAYEANWQWYDQYGYPITESGGFHSNDQYYNQWVTLELTLPIDNDTVNSSRGVNTANDLNGKIMYLSNIRICKEKVAIVPTKTEFSILSTEADLTAGNVKPSNTSSVSLTYCNETIGTGEQARSSGVFAWKNISSASVQNTVANLQWGNANAVKYLKAGNYLYLDFYFTEGQAVYLCGPDTRFYEKWSNATASSDAYQWYTADGTAIDITDTGVWGSRAYDNQWLTVEIKLDMDMAANSAYRGFSIWNEYFEAGDIIYISNMRVSVGQKLDLTK